MTKLERDVFRVVEPAQVREWLFGDAEIALIDVREEGQFGLGHLLLAVNIPYSRLEADFVLRVPLRETCIVLVDGGDGIAAKALVRLQKIGYLNLHVLEGGFRRWKTAGYELFDGVNVPSKAFAEMVEITAHTPAISPEELVRLQTSGQDLVILDPRTAEEFERFHVPGARSAPGVELVARIGELVPSPDTLIVVSCAGRTRGIIGAQALINAGVPNKVVSLAGGTQAWRIAGFKLESGPAGSLPPRGGDSARQAQARAERLRAEHGIPTISRETLHDWQSAASRRTTFVFDVRTQAEYEKGHIAGARWAPGGQLVQALDHWVAVRKARIVLVDDDGVRATAAAQWLAQMGWEVFILIGPPDTQPEGAGTSLFTSDPYLPLISRVSATEAVAWLGVQGAIVSTDNSAKFRAGHPEGAHWVNRARIDRLKVDLHSAVRILVVGDDAVAVLVAGDLKDLTRADVRVLAGGTKAWVDASLPVTNSLVPPDADCIDTLFWNHRRHDGDLDAMRAYLRWELELPQRIELDGTAGFRVRR